MLRWRILKDKMSINTLLIVEIMFENDSENLLLLFIKIVPSWTLSKRNLGDPINPTTSFTIPKSKYGECK